MPYPVGHRAEVESKIIDSARQLFNRHGFESVSIKQIMAGAGFDVRRLLQLFPQQKRALRKDPGFVFP
jgi:AcrR family transcriptional regulator